LKETGIPKDKEECKQFITSYNGECIMQSNLLNLHEQQAEKLPLLNIHNMLS